MSTHYRNALAHLRAFLDKDSPDAVAARMKPKKNLLPTRLPGGTLVDDAALAKRWRAVSSPGICREEILDAKAQEHREKYRNNIENFVGTVKVPLGLAGPLRINGTFAQGDYLLPLATTEAALVASYHRGACVVSQAGGCTTLMLAEGVLRSPGFVFRTLEQVGRFMNWCLPRFDEFKAIAETTTRHGQLVDMRFNIEGNHVYLVLEFTTADASGQNMVTIATQSVCDHILAQSPVRPTHMFVEANYSGDKKASALTFQSVRGRKVVAEVRLPKGLVEKWLHTTPEKMEAYWRMSALGGVMSGTIGVQGHYANGLAALFLACGQDIACVAEAAVGVTRFEMESDGGLYASVTLPNLIVGTVGGGTGLPTQAACLEILGLCGEGKARALAEVCAGMVLAGELSIIGALSASEFTRAHHRLARGKTKTGA
ncbi:MAG: hydroxymethylglutaryl-CoA reductase [Puniceicoccales bacterium]|jgi:hydroxymethylglutaryl-CoA reductase (NADPH)|nr:hydroxymethylglutaryl-CoA reductase [Puniceicoccales bacterium]